MKATLCLPFFLEKATTRLSRESDEVSNKAILIASTRLSLMPLLQSLRKEWGRASDIALVAKLAGAVR
jgi:hypothetical protein